MKKELEIKLIHIPDLYIVILYVVKQTHTGSLFGKTNTDFECLNGFVLSCSQTLSYDNNYGYLYLNPSKDKHPPKYITLPRLTNNDLDFLERIKKAVKEYNEYFSTEEEHTKEENIYVENVK